MAGFVPSPKGKAGRKAWEPGQRCHEFNVLTKRADFLKKYAQKVQFSGDRSSAAYSCLGRPQLFLNPTAFAQACVPDATELTNRPAFGFSELAPSLEALHQVMKDQTIVSICSGDNVH